MKEKENQYSHLGSYGVIIRDNKILLIKKNGGPYDGKLDLPGGTIDFETQRGGGFKVNMLLPI